MKKGRKIEMNSVQCKKCGQILISKDPDMVLYCKCGTIWITGGKEKLLRGGMLTFVNELSVYGD